MESQQIVKVVLVVVAGGILLYFLIDYNNRQTKIESKEAYAPYRQEGFSSGLSPAPYTSSEKVQPSDSGDASGFKTIDATPVASGGGDCFPRDRLTAEDLLPKDAANTKWAQVNPIGQGELKDKNFLNAGYHIGINTVSGSLRNANYQLRSDPVIPQKVVSPWMQSTITPDLNRLPLEIGGCSGSA
jgi:hypothetical protein